MQDTDIIEINDEQAHNAKILASNFSNPQIRKRGMIEMLGIGCALNYLHAKKFRIDTKRSVHKIPLLFEEFKITDIYYGNYRIDVITLFKEKTIKIPKIHVDMDILPHFYFIVQVGSKIKEAKMVGFIEAKKVLSCSHDSKFYYPTLDMIFDIRKFATLTKHSIPSKTLLGKHVDCMGLFLKFIDNDLSSVYKRQMIQHLMNCDSCRARFIDTMEFERLANNIRHYPDLIKRNEARVEAKKFTVELNSKNKFVDFEEGLKNIIIETPSDEREQDNFIINDENIDIEDKPKTVQMFDLLDKVTDKKQMSKKVIDAIFDEIPKLELPPIKTIANAKNRRAILIGIVLIFILASFALISIKGTSDIIEENNEIASFEEFDEDTNYSESFDYDSKQILPPSTQIKEKNFEDYTIKQPKFNPPTYAPSITRISWEAPEALVNKGSYTKFLQLIGKNIKLNLQNDLLLINEIPTNKMAKVDIRIAQNGDVEEIKLVTTSGSNLIDNSIRKIVKETLTYMKPPHLGIKAKFADITLTVELN